MQVLRRLSHFNEIYQKSKTILKLCMCSGLERFNIHPSTWWVFWCCCCCFLFFFLFVFCFVCFFLFIFLDKGSLYSTGWSETHFVTQEGLKLRANLLLQLPQVLGLQASASIPSLGDKFCASCYQIILHIFCIYIFPFPLLEVCSCRASLYYI